MAVNRSTTPNYIADWWKEIAGMSLEVEQTLQKELKDGESKNSEDFQEFQKAKQIYGNMAEHGQKFFDADHGNAKRCRPLGDAIENEGKKFNIDAKGLPGSAGGQLQIIGPLTYALAKKYLALQNKFVTDAKEEKIIAPPGIGSISLGLVKSKALKKAEDRSKMLKAAVAQYEDKLKLAEAQKNARPVEAASVPSNLPPAPSSSAHAPGLKTSSLLGRLKYMVTSEPKEVPEDGYLTALQEELALLEKTKGAIDLKRVPDATACNEVLLKLKIEIDEKISLRTDFLKKNSPVKGVDEYQYKEIAGLERKRVRQEEVYKDLERLALKKELYTSLKNIIKDHKAWSHLVEYKKFGGGRSIIDAKGGTDKVPTGIESMMQCLSVGAEAFQKKESSKFERFKRPFYTPIDIKDIDKRQNLDDKAIVADIQQLREIAKERLVQKNAKYDNEPVNKFYYTVMHITDDDLANPARLMKLITEINDHHANLRVSPAASAGNKSPRLI